MEWWRLPNVKELGSIGILDRTRSNPAIDTVAFPATPPTSFWSSSPYASNAPYAWVVDFSYGGVNSVSVSFRVSGDAVHLVR